MKHFTYSLILVDGEYNHPQCFLPTNTTYSISYSGSWYAASEVQNLDIIHWFNPIETTKEIFDEAYSAYMSDKTGSI
jgi:hypothetical protein